MLPLSICLGETQTFNDTLAALHGLIDQDSGSVCSRAARLLHSCTALGLYMPHFVPEWIKDGQFAGLPSELIPFAIYTRCKYLLAAKARDRGQGRGGDRAELFRRTRASA
ncbi:MAG: hypothetical protein V8S72_05555 [Oscillospiraceae bacterium]